MLFDESSSSSRLPQFEPFSTMVKCNSGSWLHRWNLHDVNAEGMGEMWLVDYVELQQWDALKEKIGTVSVDAPL